MAFSVSFSKKGLPKLHFHTKEEKATSLKRTQNMPNNILFGNASFFKKNEMEY